MASKRRAVVVGSGPAGYTAAIYLARAGLEPLVLEGTELGGALMTTGAVENFPGFDQPILGPELMGRMRNQARNVGAELVTVRATGLDLTVGQFTVEAGTEVHSADAVVLAMGSAPRMLGLPEEEWAMGSGLATCAACDGFFYKGQPIVVVGGGDAALEDAIYLAEICPEVTVVHRRGEFRAASVLQQRAESLGVKFQMNSVVTGLIQEGGRVAGVHLADVDGGHQRSVESGALFVGIGQIPRTELLGTQLSLSDSVHVVAEPLTATSPNTCGSSGAGRCDCRP